MPYTSRGSLPLKVAFAGAVVGVIALGVVALATLVPAMTSSPGYSRLPSEPCNAVSVGTLRQATGKHEISRQEGSATSATCEWRTEGGVADVGNGRFGRLNVDYSVKLDGEHPEPSEVQDALQRVAKSPDGAQRVDLGDGAIRIFDSDSVRLVVGRANLLITVEYDAVQLHNVAEEPLPQEELATVARQAAQDVLDNTGTPE